MQLKRHIFEIKQEMNAEGWSHISNDEYRGLDYFTQEFIKDTLLKEDGEGFQPSLHSITMGNGTMFFVDEQREF